MGGFALQATAIPTELFRARRAAGVAHSRKKAGDLGAPLGIWLSMAAAPRVVLMTARRRPGVRPRGRPGQVGRWGARWRTRELVHHAARAPHRAMAPHGAEPSRRAQPPHLAATASPGGGGGGGSKRPCRVARNGHARRRSAVGARGVDRRLDRRHRRATSDLGRERRAATVAC